LAGSAAFRHGMNQLQTCAEQLAAVNAFFSELAARGRRLQYEELAA
jgi:tRNA-dihydrouridine synthase B